MNGVHSPGVWTHAAAVYDGTAMRLYKDGVEVGSTAKSGAISTNNSVPVWIGDNPIAGSQSFDGLLDEVRIYERALTLQDIQALINGTPPDVTPPAAPIRLRTVDAP